MKSEKEVPLEYILMKKIKTIYIIDDDPITVFGIRKILESIVDCKNISTFGNGKLALDAITQIISNTQDIPDVIFLDINMPIMDGWQFLEEFTTLPIKKKIRVNIVTSSIDDIDRKRWQSYQGKTHHSITFNNKPLRKENLADITTTA